MTILPTPASTATCFTCGRCCFGPREYVQVFNDDLRLLGPTLAARLVVDKPQEERFMRMENGHCAALDTSHGLFRCTIYEQRPLICRVYKMYGPSSACPLPPNETKELPRWKQKPPPNP